MRGAPLPNARGVLRGGGNRGLKRLAPPVSGSQQIKKAVKASLLQCITLEVGGDSKIRHSLEKFALNPSPCMYGGDRGDNFAVKLPLKQQNGFDMLADHKLTATWLGMDCHVCPTQTNTHDIKGKKVFILGDQFLPWRVGQGGNCVPLLRIEDGDCTAIRHALVAQVNNGFKPEEGSIFAVALLSHLCRVGSQHFWRELDDLARWCQGVFKATLWPFLPPFPVGFPAGCLVAIHRFLTELQGRYLGDFQGRVEGRYTLWYPLDKFFNDLKAEKTEMSAEHIFVGAKMAPMKNFSSVQQTDGRG